MVAEQRWTHPSLDRQSGAHNIGWIHQSRSIPKLWRCSILLNGVPRKDFHYKRGVRRGDPLSPLLFVMAVDLLQSIVNRAYQQGLFSLPIPNRDMNHFPIVQYADDTLLIMPADARQLFCLKALLQSFALSTGLKVIFHKSCLIPINVPVISATAHWSVWFYRRPATIHLFGNSTSELGLQNHWSKIMLP